MPIAARTVGWHSVRSPVVAAMASSTDTQLEPAAERCSRRLRELIRQQERTQELLLQLTDDHETLAERLSAIGATLASESRSPGTANSVRTLSALLRALRAGALMLDAAALAESRQLGLVRDHAGLVADLVAALRQAAPREDPFHARPAAQPHAAEL